LKYPGGIDTEYFARLAVVEFNWQGQPFENFWPDWSKRNISVCTDEAKEFIRMRILELINGDNS